MTHMHDFDDEPPVQLDKDGNPYPYMCRACEQETGDPYAWVPAALAALNEKIMIRCRWFAKCRNEADKQVEHPTLGWVNICDEHIAWLGTNPSPTQFVPPLAAAVLDRRGLTL